MAFTLGPRAKSAGYRLESFDQIGSTNSEAMTQARAGERGPMWFATTEQTSGRGRRQRPWIAPRGNLAASVLETLDVAPAVAATLGFAAGLALEAALRAVAGSPPLRFSLKWPNDVLAGQAKLSGILLEAEAVPSGGLAVVVGMGTNVVAAPEGTPIPATSLVALGVETTAEKLFAALSDSWAECRGIWDNGRGFVEIRRRWLALAAGLGQPVTVHTGQTVSGTFDTIDDTGCMIVRTSAGDRVPVSAGDVHFGQAASARAG
jgi:BirA family biotin operon repressor/biotin-[acetyl-CoA-carboxylase] ligase